MDTKNAIIIFDNNVVRSGKLCTIFDFIGESCCESNYERWQAMVGQQPKLIVVGGSSAPGETIDLLKKITDHFVKTPVVLVGSAMTTSQCDQYNVQITLTFPFTYAQLTQALHQCQIMVEKGRTEEDSQKTNPLFRSLAGNSEAICGVRKLIEQVADTDATVLVLGESGTGKEVAARNIHALSSRAHKPFIPINCGAIPAELLESELFGHEKGAFTGAITARQGRFELANGGTLFLDEIGDMPLAMQVKLLRVLQERCFERVGSNKSVHVDVRILAATHRDLEQSIRDGKFREDLYYRLNVFPIELPPLRLRRNDINLLFNELIARFEAEGRPIVHLMPRAVETLSSYDWPGNVRELANLIERLAILYPNGIVDTDDLPPRFKVDKMAEPHEQLGEREALLAIVREEQDSSSDGIDLKDHLLKTELALICKALDQSDWVVAHAASYLNMRRTTLVEKIRKYGLTRPDWEKSANNYSS